jgi:hypothetical protein
MAEGSNHTAQVTIAIITALSAVAAALIANWDKFSGGGKEPVAVVGKTVDIPGTGNVATAREIQAKDAVPEPEPEPEADGARPDSPPEGAGPPVISGIWQDDTGLQYRIEQNGAHYRFAGFAGGVPVGGGEGRIVGRTMTHSYETSNDAGECTGKIADGERLAFGTCTNVYEATIPFRIRR